MTAPAKPRLVIVDGSLLTRPGIGIGAFAGRLVAGLLRRAGELPFSLEVCVPRTAELPDTVRMGAPGALRTLWSPSTGHELIDACLWRGTVARHVRRRSPEAVFFSPALFWSPWSPGRRAVVTCHDVIYRFFPQYLGRSGVRRWLTYRAESFLHRCRFVVTESESASRDLQREVGLPAARIRVIPAWLPDSFSPAPARAAAPEVRARYRLPPRFWLYLGGYDCRKHVEYLLEAYARTRTQAPVPPLVLAGRIPPARGAGPVCDVRGTLARLGLGTDSGVLLPGFVAESDLPGLYAAADLFVYPSQYEGFGLPPLEAMGCGCPALAADTSSLPEVVRDADYRFDIRRPESLVAHLVRAARAPLPLNPAFRREDFDEGRALDAYVDVFVRCLEGEDAG